MLINRISLFYLPVTITSTKIGIVGSDSPLNMTTVNIRSCVKDTLVIIRDPLG